MGAIDKTYRERKAVLDDYKEMYDVRECVMIYTALHDQVVASVRRVAAEVAKILEFEYAETCRSSLYTCTHVTELITPGECSIVIVFA